MHLKKKMKKEFLQSSYLNFGLSKKLCITLLKMYGNMFDIYIFDASHSIETPSVSHDYMYI